MATTKTAHSKKNTPSPPQTASAQDRRKLIVLGALAFVVILLFWIWTLPLNFNKTSNATVAGPKQLFTTLGGELSTLGRIGDIFKSPQQEIEPN